MSGQESQAEPASEGTGQTQSRPPTCYNCGANDHFMMACPEPTRTIPAGLEAARAAQAAQTASGKEGHSHTHYHKFPKRQKSYGGPVVTRYPAPRGGPVVTRYGPAPVPYNGQQAYPPYGAYAPPSVQQSYHQGAPPPQQAAYGQYPQYGYPQAPQPYTQPHGPTPVSSTPAYGQAVPYQYAPQRQPAPHYQQGYQQPYGSTGPAYPPQQYAPYPPSNAPPHRQPGTPYVPPTNAYPHPSPSPYPNHASNQGPLTHQQTYPSQLQIPPSQKSLPPTGQTSPITPYPPHGFQGSPTLPASATNHTSRSSSISSIPQGLGIGPQTHDQNSEDAEFEWLLQRAFREPKFRPADPIRTPLPAIFNDEIILPPPYDSPFVVSKYAKLDNVEEFCKSIRDTEAWADLQHDPAFKEIDREAPFILFEDLAAWTEERCARNSYEDDKDHYDEHDRRASGASRKRAWSEEHEHEQARKRHASDYRKSSNSHLDEDIEMQGAEEDDHPFRLSPMDSKFARAESHTTDSRERSTTPALDGLRSSQNNTKNDVWAPEPEEGAPISSTTDTKEAILASFDVTSSSKLVKKPAKFNMPDIEIPQGHQTYRQDSGYGSGRGSYSNGGGYSGWEQHRNHQEPRSSKHNYQTEPPPSRALKELSRQRDNAIDSPASSYSSQEVDGRKNFGDTDVAQEYQDDEMSSPLSPTSAELLGYGQPTTSSDARHRRGDGNSRRRQPRVADAYSRRW